MCLLTLFQNTGPEAARQQAEANDRSGPHVALHGGENRIHFSLPCDLTVRDLSCETASLPRPRP